jgi:hypothetical protein
VMSYRIALFISTIAILPISYIARFSQGFGAEWLHDLTGSLAYEIFWILLVMVCVPKACLMRVAIAVFFASCAIEFLQLWKPPLLQAIRATLPGRLMLGNTFTWSDLCGGQRFGVGVGESVASMDAMT